MRFRSSPAHGKRSGTATSPAGTRRNLDWVRPHLRAGAGITEDDLLVLADAQTSGGLLVVGELPGTLSSGTPLPASGIEVR